MQPIFADPDQAQVQGVVGVMMRGIIRIGGWPISPHRSTPTRLFRQKTGTRRSRTYSNFCSIAHTPFDSTLTFCEVMPLSDKEIRDAQTEHVVICRCARASSYRCSSSPISLALRNICASTPSRQQRGLEQGRSHSPMPHSARALVSCARASGLCRHTTNHEVIKRRRHHLRCPDEQHPGADTELHFTNAFELLTATIPSAQSTDQREHGHPGAVRAIRDATALMKATLEELEPQIHRRPASFARSRARSSAWPPHSVEQHGGQVPVDMDARSMALPGVGRKTANVVLGHAPASWLPAWLTGCGRR